AVFALLSEMALAAWIFNRLGVGWLFGVLTAVFITFTLHGVFLQIFDNSERPKEAIYRIRRVAALPAIFGFLIALGLGMLARYVYGSLAVALLPLFSLSLWLGTISLLVLAASLFTVAHLRGWSVRYEKQYRKLDAEERASSSFLKELQDEAGATAAPGTVQPSQAAPPVPAPRPTDGRGAAVSAILPLMIALCVNGGGSTGAGPAPAPVAAPPPAPAPPRLRLLAWGRSVAAAPPGS